MTIGAIHEHLSIAPGSSEIKEKYLSSANRSRWFPKRTDPIPSVNAMT